MNSQFMSGWCKENLMMWQVGLDNKNKNRQVVYTPKDRPLPTDDRRQATVPIPLAAEYLNIRL